MIFKKSFTQQNRLPIEALHAAHRVLSSASLHRYQEGDLAQNEVASLEKEFANWQDAKYCLAVTSCGQAMQLALRSVGVSTGDAVLTNGFTLAPVPGAICAVGAQPVLVEISSDLAIDVADLRKKAHQSGAHVLLLSHMRGHLPNMRDIIALADDLNLTVIEDCAHTMGATWDGQKSGNFGRVGCFSTQSYKHLNSGEGGFLTTNDPDVMARAIVTSGSYMHYSNHGAAPGETHFDSPKYECANMSARMDVLRASILRPQLAELDLSVARWNELCSALAAHLESVPGIMLPRQSNLAMRVGSSIQFQIPQFSASECVNLVARSATRGVRLKWFGDTVPVAFTSNHTHWHHVPPQALPQTDAILSTLFDMRIPLTFEISDCSEIAKIIGDVAQDIMAETV